MSSGMAYPGCIGRLHRSGIHDLSDDDISALRDDIASIANGADQPDAFLADLVHAAELQRCSAALDGERLYQSRVANLDFVAKDVRANRLNAVANLTVINALALRLTPDASATLILERIALLRDNLPKLRRGPPDQDSLVYMAVAVAEAFRQHLGREPSCKSDSDFTHLLERVAEAADSRPRKGMHGLAEQAVRIKLVEDSPGVTFYRLPRFDRMELDGTS